MRVSQGFIGAPLAFAAILFATGSAHSVARDAREMEVARLRAHFDSVVTELSSARTADLTSSQRTRRTLLIAELQHYRDAGVFPQNRDYAGQAVPFFVDEQTGAICAVGHLLAVSGRRDIVDRVRETNNNVLVAQLASDADFRAWLDSAGISLAEAGRIQVPYAGDGGWNDPAPTARGESGVNMGYVAGAAAASGASLAAAMWNATLNKSGRGKLANMLGIGSGLAAIAVGTAGAAVPTGVNHTGVTALRVGSIATGAASMFLGARGLHRHRVFTLREATLKREAAKATVTPIMVTDGAPSAGMAVAIRF